MNNPRSGRVQDHMIYFLNFWTPSVSFKRVKLDTSFPLWLSGHSEYYTTDAGCLRKGAWSGSRDLFFNFKYFAVGYVYSPWISCCNSERIVKICVLMPKLLKGCHFFGPPCISTPRRQSMQHLTQNNDIINNSNTCSSSSSSLFVWK